MYTYIYVEQGCVYVCVCVCVHINYMRTQGKGANDTEGVVVNSVANSVIKSVVK